MLETRLQASSVSSAAIWEPSVLLGADATGAGDERALLRQRVPTGLRLKRCGQATVILAMTR